MKKLTVLLVLLLGTCQVAPAYSHGWYDYDCCSDNDCAPIIKETALPDGSLEVTTKHGTAIFPPNFPVRSSKDEHSHACFIPSTKKPLCLYRGAGV